MKAHTLTIEQINRISSELFVKPKIEPADLLFIFGNRTCEEAYGAAAGALWHAGFFQNIIVSGGPTGGSPTPEADIIAQKLVAHGVPEDRILKENQATNTGENVEFGLGVLDDRIGLENIRSVLAMGMVCTSRRYLMTLQRHWPDVQKSLLAVNYFNRPLNDWPDHVDMRERIVGEWCKLSIYKERGFIVDWSEDLNMISAN